MKSDTGSRRDFARVVCDDSYFLRSFPVGYFTHILDVGANMGAFSMLARCMNPKAKIVALEPADETYAMLRENTELFEVEAVQAALGDGNPVGWVHRAPDMSVRNIFLPGGTGSDTMPSMRLPQLAARAAINEKSVYFLKIDCEGAERTILELDDRDVLAGAACLAIELHYQRTDSAEKIAKDPTQKFRLPYERYARFFAETLGDTHVGVRPMQKLAFGVSEHLFVHKRHYGVFGKPLSIGAPPPNDSNIAVELTEWRATHLVAAAEQRANGRPIFLWGENSLGARVAALLEGRGRKPSGVVDRKGGTALTPDQFRVTHGAGGAVFVLVCSHSARDPIATELRGMSLQEGDDFACLPMLRPS